MTQKPATPFSGRHIATIMIAFFGTVIAVNMLMAALATGTFGGTVVDNSYVASQKFNSWLGEARAQKALGWHEEIGLNGDHRIDLMLANERRPQQGANITAVARHPLGRAPERTFGFTEVRPGQYRAATPLPAGRWIVHFTIKADGREMRLIEDLQ
jgi:nitrogen fixation protein FixH